MMSSSDLNKMLRLVEQVKDLQNADVGVEAMQSALLEDGKAAVMTVTKIWVGIDYRIDAVTRNAGITIEPPAGAQLDVVVPVTAEPSEPVEGTITLEQLGVLIASLAAVLENLREGA